MRLQNGDTVMYEEPSTVDENGKEHIELSVKTVKRAIYDGIQFLDKDDNLNYNYRVKYIFRNGAKIQNCCYDFLRITEENKKCEGD